MTGGHNWKKEMKLLLFFDIKKAFDSVPHQRLSQKLVDINLDT